MADVVTRSLPLSGHHGGSFAVRLEAARAGLTELSQRVSVPAENLLSPDTVRRLCWDWEPVDDTAAVVERFLRDAGARRWQRDLTVPVLTAALTAASTPATDDADVPADPDDAETADRS